MNKSSITEHSRGCQLRTVACTCGMRTILVLGILGAPAGICAQEVFLDATPLIGVSAPVPPTGPAAPTTVTVPPGTVVPFELGAFVQPDPASPTVNGLASFDVDILTTLGVAQPPMTAFDPLILQTFTVSPNLGFPSDGSILNVTARQDLAGFANTGVGVGRRQRLATGQLNTPTVEGDFQVTLAGTAEQIATGPNPLVPGVQPATVGTTGFVIQTRVDAEVPEESPPVIDPESPAADFGASLVDLCFPGVVLAVSACLAGLIALRWHFDR